MEQLLITPEFRLVLVAKVANSIRTQILDNNGVYDGASAPNIQTIIDIILLPSDVIAHSVIQWAASNTSEKFLPTEDEIKEVAAGWDVKK